jgi:2-alkyl-3-oxoalkanoate reductase
MKRAVLVLGAGGFIGGRITAALAATDWARPVPGLHRRPAAAGALEHRTVEATQVESVRAAMRDVGAVVNCVAGDSATIVASAQALAKAAAAITPPPRIVHLSTMSVYGSATGEIGESTPLRGDIGPYSVAKIAAEEALSSHSDAIMLRPGVVFGPGSPQWSARIAQLLLSRRLGELGAAGDGYCNLVHVDDVALAVVRALEQERLSVRALNLVVSEPPTWNEALAVYARALRAPALRAISPLRLKVESRLLAPPLKVAEILARAAGLGARSLPPPIPPSFVHLMAQKIRLDSRHARSALGIAFRDVGTTLGDSADWVVRSAVA